MKGLLILIGLFGFIQFSSGGEFFPYTDGRVYHSLRVPERGTWFKFEKQIGRLSCERLVGIITTYTCTLFSNRTNEDVKIWNALDLPVKEISRPSEGMEGGEIVNRKSIGNLACEEHLCIGCPPGSDNYTCFWLDLDSNE